MAANIVIVDDGQYRWGADRAQLLAALSEQGWVETASGMWQEPEASAPSDLAGDDPYTALCGMVDSLAGEGSTEPVTDELLESAGRFTLRPDYGDGVWTLDA